MTPAHTCCCGRHRVTAQLCSGFSCLNSRESALTAAADAGKGAGQEEGIGAQAFIYFF